MLLDSPGTIALPTSEIGRFAMFTVALAATQQPPGTNLSVMASASVTENLNQSIRDLRPNDEWVWILGDDHTWEADALMELLATLDEHPEIDILVPLVTKRNPPWYLVLFHSTPNTLSMNGTSSLQGVPAWQPFAWEEIPTSGTFQVDAAGSAGMLIRRQVLDTMGDPWFESSGGVYLNEDVHFCAKAAELGFAIFATADVTMGHLGIFNVRPLYRGGRWGALTEFSSAEEQFKHIFMPDAEEAANKPVVSGR